MKALIPIFFLLLSCACGTPSHIEEGVLYRTRIYAGNHVRTEKHDGFCCVLTTDRVIVVKGYPNIPDSAWCYIRTEVGIHDLHPDIQKKLTKKYLYWIGGDKEYQILER
jgi:hypothetical protein